jgi:hypothetical protein
MPARLSSPLVEGLSTSESLSEMGILHYPPICTGDWLRGLRGACGAFKIHIPHPNSRLLLKMMIGTLCTAHIGPSRSNETGDDAAGWLNGLMCATAWLGWPASGPPVQAVKLAGARKRSTQSRSDSDLKRVMAGTWQRRRSSCRATR